MIPLSTILIFSGVGAAFYSFNKWVDSRYGSDFTRNQLENKLTEELFNKFIKRCDDYDKAKLHLWLREKGSKEYTMVVRTIKDNENLIREALRTKDYSKLIKKDHIDYEYCRRSPDKIQSYFSMNLFAVYYE